MTLDYKRPGTYYKPTGQESTHAAESLVTS